MTDHVHQWVFSHIEKVVVDGRLYVYYHYYCNCGETKAVLQ